MLFVVVVSLLMVLGAISMVGQLDRGSYLCSSSDGGMVFRRPLRPRVGSALYGLALFNVAPMLAEMALQSHQTMTAGTWAWLAFDTVMNLVGGGLLWRLAGPEELRLDLEQHTYRWTRGWPFLPRTRSGSWDDMQGVYVGFVGGTRVSAYFVGIRWRPVRGGGRRVDLGRFAYDTSAEQFAERMMAVLNLPLVEPPYPLS